jgi:hypothetical protein
MVVVVVEVWLGYRYLFGQCLDFDHAAQCLKASKNHYLRMSLVLKTAQEVVVEMVA